MESASKRKYQASAAVSTDEEHFSDREDNKTNEEVKEIIEHTRYLFIIQTKKRWKYYKKN